MEYKKHGLGYYKMLAYPKYMQVYTEDIITGDPCIEVYGVEKNWEDIALYGEKISEDEFREKYRQARHDLDEIAFGARKLSNKLEPSY